MKNDVSFPIIQIGILGAGLFIGSMIPGVYLIAMIGAIGHAGYQIYKHVIPE